jgi:hypothetical protein
MTFSLGNIWFNDDTVDSNGAKWYASLDGWDSLPQRTGVINQPGRHGSITVENLYDARQMTIQGIAVAEDANGAWLSQQLLATETAALTVFADPPLLLTQTGPVELQMTVLRTSLLVRCIDDLAFEYELTLRADDPFKYSATTSSLVAPGTATNDGTAITYPVFYVTALSTPTITNGAQVWTANAALPMDTVIDMREMTVMNSGTNYLGNVNLASVWWGLAPGDSTISWTGSLEMVWRAAYQ